VTTPLRLALCQSPAELGPTERLNWLDDTLKNHSADLFLLPELFASGYNIGATLKDRAEPVSGATAQTVKALAIKHKTAVHYGFPEQTDGATYNAALCIGPDGTTLCLQRKLIIPPGFERDIFSAGKGCSTFDYMGLKIATLICYDAEFPETVRYVAGQGADLVLVPTALGDQWGWVARTMMPTRAYENGVFLAYANSAGTENGLTFLGESVIAAPDGTECARAGSAPEILIAEIDKSRVTVAQKRLPYLADRHALTLD
jgi:predicted amidohydrolase